MPRLDEVNRQLQEANSELRSLWEDRYRLESYNKFIEFKNSDLQSEFSWLHIAFQSSQSAIEEEEEHHQSMQRTKSKGKGKTPVQSNDEKSNEEAGGVR